MSQNSSHLQCTDLRRFRNTAMESLSRFLHSFRPRFSFPYAFKSAPWHALFENAARSNIVRSESS